MCTESNGQAKVQEKGGEHIVCFGMGLECSAKGACIGVWLECSAKSTCIGMGLECSTGVLTCIGMVLECSAKGTFMHWNGTEWNAKGVRQCWAQMLREKQLHQTDRKFSVKSSRAPAWLQTLCFVMQLLATQLAEGEAM